MIRTAWLIALACAVSPAVAQKVRVDWDHGSRFSRYKTYRWVSPVETQPPGEPFPNQLMQERIVKFTEEALAAKGLRRVDKGGDLLVGYQLRVTEQEQLVTVGSGWGWGSDFSTTTTETILTGTLEIDMTDPRHNQLVFQGVSSATISSRPQKNTKKLRKGINEIFEKYPPNA